MSTKKDTSAVTKEELSREEKKKLRREAIQDKNTLTVPDSIKKPGMQYRLCSVKNIGFHRSRGYEIAKALDAANTGTDDVNKAVSATGSYEVIVDKVHGDKAVWMETTEENYQILLEIDQDKAQEQADMLDQKANEDGDDDWQNARSFKFKKGIV